MLYFRPDKTVTLSDNIGPPALVMASIEPGQSASSAEPKQKPIVDFKDIHDAVLKVLEALKTLDLEKEIKQAKKDFDDRSNRMAGPINVNSETGQPRSVSS